MTDAPERMPEEIWAERNTYRTSRLYGRWTAGKHVPSQNPGTPYLRADLVPSWQPIETAPRDGTEILGYREDLGTWIVRWDSDEEGFTPGFKPTHWMPLPEPLR